MIASSFLAEYISRDAHQRVALTLWGLINVALKLTWTGRIIPRGLRYLTAVNVCEVAQDCPHSKRPANKPGRGRRAGILAAVQECCVCHPYMKPAGHKPIYTCHLREARLSHDSSKSEG